uniref:Glutamate decarboxylase 2 n=1 Tax=Anser cygnoides TaxID=8845 RepID=A0A8B9IQU1_ANSCY
MPSAVAAPGLGWGLWVTRAHCRAPYWPGAASPASLLGSGLKICGLKTRHLREEKQPRWARLLQPPGEARGGPGASKIDVGEARGAGLLLLPPVRPPQGAGRPGEPSGLPRALPGEGTPGEGSSGDTATPNPARRARVCPCRCQALLYGDAEKPVETGARAAPGAAEPRPVCTCDKKPCGCQKADVNYAFLHSTDLLPACNGEITTMSFLQDVVDILLQYVVKSFDRSTKVIDFHYPNELLQEYNWELADQPQTLEEILLNCRTTLKYAIKTGHPRYFNQLSTGLDMVGLAADWLTSAANTNMFTYEIAPVFVLLEYVTLRKMREMVGWPGGCGDGIFSPGGAISNMYAMLIARFKMFPEVKEKGMAAIPRLVAFTSEHSHFSVKKGAAALGIGTDSVILIRCDERYSAQRDATAGTTVYGAFDPLIAIADICKKYKIWMHVDGAWGGGLLMSRKHKWKLNGVERANSVTWNPHKMMGVPLQCSALLVREEGLMQSCNQMHASYLFQQDKHYDLSYDTGDKALQCGRHVDVFKLWLMWRAKGTTGFEAQIDKCLELAEYLYNKIKNREGYEMVFDGKPQHTNVCFWYIPPSLRSMEDNEERMSRLMKVAPVIKARMMEYGTTMVSYQPLGDKVNFFRMVISNPAATHQDIDFLIDEIERLGQDL